MKKTIFLLVSSITLFIIIQTRSKSDPKDLEDASASEYYNDESEKVLTLPINKSFKEAIVTVFWVGEKANTTNGYIANLKSAWDHHWTEHFGGEDHPENRCDTNPCTFSPKENPFYFALPYNDIDMNGIRKASARKVAWFKDQRHKRSILKNIWIEIIYKKNKCYAQWEDVGPFEEDDFDYVFGSGKKAKNIIGAGAGLDISPATWDCLKLRTNSPVKWRFIDEKKVPNGDWKKIITLSNADFS